MRSIIRIALTAVLVGALGFFGGVKYSQGTAASSGGSGGSSGTGAASGASGARTGGAAGEVIAADGSSITIKLADGSTRTVYVSSWTRITDSAEATLTDLAKGITVVASGSSDSSETLTARNIQIVPAGSDLTAFGQRGGGPQGAPGQ